MERGHTREENLLGRGLLRERGLERGSYKYLVLLEHLCSDSIGL